MRPMRKLFLVILALTALVAAGTPFYGESITSTSTPSTTEKQFSSGSVRITSATTSNPVYVRFSKDFLRGGNFEDTALAPSSSYLDECGDTGTSFNSTGPWFANGSATTSTLACAVSTAGHGNGILTLTDAGSELIADEGLETVAGDDWTSWTENVNSGSGTIAEEGTIIVAGSASAKLTGGSAHVDFTSATITVTASTEYVLSVWGYLGASGDLLDVRVREATGGTDFLQADGSWAASEVDFCTATFTDGSWTQCVVRFTTDTGITGITVSANVDVSGDIGYVDNWALMATSDEQIFQLGTDKINRTVADSYQLCFEWYGSTGDQVIEYAIIDPDIYADEASLAPQYYTGSAWTTTETWLAPTAASSITTVCAPFEARSAVGHFVQVKFRPKTFGTDGTDVIYLDTIRLNEAASTADGALLTVEALEYEITSPGRFSVVSASSTLVNFAESK